MEQPVHNLQRIWDYMHMNMVPRQADCIVGFGNYNIAIAERAAELYHQKLAPNTDNRWTGTEAERFAAVASAHGVPEKDIILEDRSTNTAFQVMVQKGYTGQLIVE